MQVRASDIGIVATHGPQMISRGPIAGQQIFVGPRDIIELNQYGSRAILHISKVEKVYPQEPDRWRIDSITSG